MSRLGRQGLIGAATIAVSLIFGVSSAAAITIGDVNPAASVTCSGPFDGLQDRTTGNQYAVPSTGGVTNWTVTSWSTRSSVDPAGSMALKFFHKVGDPDRYMAVAHDGRRSISEDGSLRTFPVNLQVKAGDVLGFHFEGTGFCASDAAADRFLDETFIDLADGASSNFTEEGPYRANISADITPTNSFTVDKVKPKKNGTATLQANLPNPGDLTVSGKGLKGSASAVSAKQVSAGTVTVVIRAKGKNKRKLVENGKVTVKPTITYTPTGGSSTALKKKVKLHRK
jgi:hypothetical protein